MAIVPHSDLTDMTTKTTTTVNRTRGGRKTATNPLITSADALPSAVVLPAGIRESDPIKALPMVIKRLNAKTTEAAKWAKKADDLAQEKTSLVDSLAEEKRLHGLSKMSDANARGILSQIHTELGGDANQPAIDKVHGLVLRCNQYGGRSDRMGEANTKLQAENGALREELQHINLQLDNRREDVQAAGARIESLTATNKDLEAQVTRLAAECRDLTPLLPPWFQFLSSVVVIGLVALLAHKAGFSAGMEVAK